MTLREQMKADLTGAMKARQSETVTTLRSVLAAIDNAEAIPVSETTFPVEPVVGQRHEALRKMLSVEDIRALVQKEMDERRAASLKYAKLGLQVEAERLQAAANLLAGYLQG